MCLSWGDSLDARGWTIVRLNDADDGGCTR